MLPPEQQPSDEADTDVLNLTRGETLTCLKGSFCSIPGVGKILDAITPLKNPNSNNAGDIADRLVTILMENHEETDEFPAIREIIGKQRSRVVAVLNQVLECQEPQSNRIDHPVVLVDKKRALLAFLVEEIGDGGFGTVGGYLWNRPEELDPSEESNDAFKVFKRSKAFDRMKGPRRAKLEFDILDLLGRKGRGVPKVHMFGTTTDGYLYMGMERIKGLSLETVIRCVKAGVGHDSEKQAQWPTQWMYLVIASLAQSMYEIHNLDDMGEVAVESDGEGQALKDSGLLRQGKNVRILHRDIKPENVMLTVGGLLKILDFGTSKWKGGDTDLTQFTEEGQVFGTPDYLFPEGILLDDSNPPSEKSDVYSLGCTVNKLLTGSAPYAHLSDASTKLQAHINEDGGNSKLLPRLGPFADPEVKAFVMGMISKNQESRPTDMETAQFFHERFLNGASQEDQERYGDFLSRPHADRKLPMPEGVDFSSLGQVLAEAETILSTAGGQTADTAANTVSQFSDSLAAYGGSPIPVVVDDASPSCYLENGEFVQRTILKDLSRWCRKNSITTGIGAVLLSCLAVLTSVKVFAPDFLKKKQGTEISQPEYNPVLQEPKAGEKFHTLKVTWGEEGLVSQLDLLGFKVTDIYQLAGHSSDDDMRKGLRPDCYFGTFYLKEEDVSRLLGISEEELLPSLKKQNIFGLRNEDGSVTNKRVNGLYGRYYLKGDSLVVKLQSIAILGLKRGGDLHCFSPFTQLKREGMKFHQSENMSTAFEDGHLQLGSTISEFPELMESLNSSGKFPHFPTSAESISGFALSRMTEDRNAVKKARKKKENSSSPQGNVLPPQKKRRKVFSKRPEHKAPHVRRAHAIPYPRGKATSKSRKGRVS